MTMDQKNALIEQICVAARILPVITIGRGGTPAHVLASPADLARAGVRVRESSRGGDVTYHGPGQLVAYPIIDLSRHGPGRDLHRYLRALEQVVVDMLGEFGIVGRREPGLTGVWTVRGKVAAVGVAVRRWVTMHGFAVNVCPAMEHFRLIVPCGIVGRPVTSMSALLGRPVAVREVLDPLVRHAAGNLGFAEVDRQDELERARWCVWG